MARFVSSLKTPGKILPHNRSALRALAPIAVSAIAALAACSDNAATTADASGSGSTSGSAGSGTDGGGSSGGTSGSPSGSSGSGSKDASVEASKCTPAPAPGATLPFVVDSVFVPSGWMGDGPAYPADPDAGRAVATPAAMTLEPNMYSTNATDACGMYMIPRSSPSAKGSCYRVTFHPFPKGQGYGWVGAYWQNKRDNWGDKGPGYAIPPGAKKISFWTRGKLGGEWVKFFAGEGDAAPCMDFSATLATNPSPVNLTTQWAQYTIDIANSPYDTGVIGAFGFATGDQTLPQVQAAADEAGAPEGGILPDGGVGLPCTDSSNPDASAFARNQVIGCTNSVVEFYIDDIEWTM